MAKTFRPNSTRTLPFSFDTRAEARRFVRRVRFSKLPMRVKATRQWTVQYDTSTTNKVPS